MYAESEFRLSGPDPENKGFTIRETLEGLLKRCKRAERRAELEAELATPPYPAELAYILTAFYRLRRRKGGNGYGFQPVEWPDIDAFLRYSGLDLAPWEIEIVESLDDLFLSERNASTKDEGN